jgi:hypothetical protein
MACALLSAGAAVVSQLLPVPKVPLVALAQRNSLAAGTMISLACVPQLVVPGAHSWKVQKMPGSEESVMVLEKSPQRSLDPPKR